MDTSVFYWSPVLLSMIASIGFIVDGEMQKNELSSMFLLIFIFFVLPAVNAVHDLLSWGVTRTLLARAAKAPGGLMGWLVLCFELLLDLIAAAVLLTMLSITLPVLFELWNRIGLATFIYWEGMADSAAALPASSGVFIAGMLATTFAPTLIHLVWGWYGALYAWSVPARIPRRLRAETLSETEIQSLAKSLQWRKLIWVPATLAALATIALCLAPLYLWLGDFTVLLRAAADLGVDLIWGGAMTPP